MTTPTCSLQVATLSSAGRVRRFNEDTVAVDQERGVALVADGMGRNRAGEVASRMARDIVVAGVRAATNGAGSEAMQVLAQAFNQANSSIFKAAQENPNYRGMASTLALVLMRGDRVALAHVGDSRVYRWRDGQLTLLTRDDTLLNDQVELGLISPQDAAASRNRHLVTQALGFREDLTPRLREEDLRVGDVYLICSDGLNEMVDEADIELIVGSLQVNLDLAAKHLVQLANDNGGLDNVSVVLVKAGAEVQPPPPPANGRFSRLLSWLR